MSGRRREDVGGSPAGMPGRTPAKKRRTGQGRALARLNPTESAQVLRSLLSRHPDLRAEAEELAYALVTTVDHAALAEDVAGAVLGLDLEDMESRAGPQPMGYVEPGEAAFEAPEEAISPFIADMRRLLDLGSVAAAEATCRAIVAGLYSLRDEASHDVLVWAPDFPLETATYTLSELRSGVASHSSPSAGAPSFVDDAPDWAEALARAGRPR